MKYKYIIRVEIESAEVSQTFYVSISKKEVISYTIEVIDTLLKNLAITDVIETYRIHEIGVME